MKKIFKFIFYIFVWYVLFKTGVNIFQQHVKEAERVGIKGFYLDGDIVDACQRLQALSNEIGFEYYTKVNGTIESCALLPKNAPKWLKEDYKTSSNLFYESTYITSENEKVTKIKFGSTVLNYLFQTSKLSTKEFCQTLVNNVSWLNNELETRVDNSGNIISCNRFDSKLGYRFEYIGNILINYLYLEKTPKTSFK